MLQYFGLYLRLYFIGSICYIGLLIGVIFKKLIYKLFIHVIQSIEIQKQSVHSPWIINLHFVINDNNLW